MSKFCTKCGYEMDETAVACPKCGAQTGVKMTSNAGITNRSIVTCILLTFKGVACLGQAIKKPLVRRVELIDL